ncbi:MAG: hypothetical protein GY832_34560 [Chloroflexi bacterium]|nr:hypothetical protein [Chloroflexota bacterium]
MSGKQCKITTKSSPLFQYCSLDQSSSPLPRFLSAPLVLQLAHSFPTVDGSGKMLGTIAIGNVDDDVALETVVNSMSSVYVYDYDGTLVSFFSTRNGTRDRRVNAPTTLGCDD